jgi:hypothetical protein
MQTLVSISLRECIEMHRNNTYPYGRTVTVGAALIIASAFMQAADAQQFRQPRSDDPERLRVIRECMEMNRNNTYQYSRTVGHMYHACMANQGHHE